MRRVVITGLGVVSPLGIGLQETAAAYLSGSSRVGPNTVFASAGYGQPLAGLIPAFDVRAFFRVPKAMKLCDRRTKLAVAASAQALTDAGLDPASPDVLEALGVLLGTSGSDLGVPDVAHALEGLSPDETLDVATFAGRVLDRLNPLWLLINLPNMSSAHVAIQVGARGPNSTMMTGLVAGLQAIGEAADLVRAGETDCMLAGAADTGVMPFAYAAFSATGLFGGGPSRAVPVRPAGPEIVPAEAAVVLVLESEAHATGRGARVRGEITRFECARLHGLSGDDIGGALAGVSGWLGGWDLGAADTVCLGSSLGARRAGAWPASVDVVDATPLAGHSLAAATPLSLACALAMRQAGRVVAWSEDPAGQVAMLEVARG